MDKITRLFLESLLLIHIIFGSEFITVLISHSETPAPKKMTAPRSYKSYLYIHSVIYIITMSEPSSPTFCIRSNFCPPTPEKRSTPTQ